MEAVLSFGTTKKKGGDFCGTKGTKRQPRHGQCPLRSVVDSGLVESQSH